MNLHLEEIERGLTLGYGNESPSSRPGFCESQDSLIESVGYVDHIVEAL